jgi:hypothetical protein
MLFGARRHRRLVSPPLSSEEKKELETILSSRE